MKPGSVNVIFTDPPYLSDLYLMRTASSPAMQNGS